MSHSKYYMKMKGLKSLALTMPLYVISCESLDNGASVKDIATPKPTPEMARLNNKSYEELIEGRSVYDTHCIMCHDNQLPSTTDLPSWHKKIHTMSEKASLSSHQENALQSYLEIFSDR